MVVAGGLLGFLASVPSGHLHGQDTEEWRLHFAAGEQARQAGESAAYADQMAAAASSMPAEHLNRPFVQYHAARAAALVGRSEEALTWLRTAWDEDIESLMISFAPYDPAFEAIAGSADFRSVMSLAGDMEISVRPLSGAVYLLQGAGSNVLAAVGAEGVLLIDTGYAPALPALRRALTAIGGGDIELLIVTHPHEDHMGATPELGAATTLLAHPGTAAQMREPYVFMDGVSMPPKPAAALPDVEITRDTTMVFNGEDVRLVPTIAHTAGDLSVYFTESHVVHFGDAYLAGNPMMYPGTVDPDGFLDRFEGFVDSMHPETIVIGGHEEPTDLSAVRRQIGVSREAMKFVRSSIAEGLTIEATAEQGSDRFAPQWVAFFYQLLSQPGS